MKAKICKLKCKKCGHEWVPRQSDVRLCPKCKTYKWDVENSKNGKAGLM
jgi:uncharacterized OB-fold protein